MQNFNSPTLNILLEQKGKELLMTWTGQSTDPNPSLMLNPYLDNLVGEMNGSGLKISFSSLDYMNSSTVPPIIQFMKKLDSKGVNTVMTYNPQSKWQTASFKAFDTLAMMMKHISVKGE